MNKRHLKRVVFGMAFFILYYYSSLSLNANDKPTVASINLCTDRLVLSLADPEQIVSLSYVAADSNSMMQTADPNVELNQSRLEELLILDVDYIFASEFDDPKLLNQLGDYGHEVRQFKAQRSIAQAQQNIKAMAQILEQPHRSDRLIKRLETIRQLDKVSNKPRTLLLGANNYISGKNTLASDVIETLGYINIANEVNVTDYGRISMEQIIELDPEVIIVSKYSDDYSRAQSVMQHPVLQRLSKKAKIIYIPTREWICADGALLNAAKRLVPQVH